MPSARALAPLAALALLAGCAGEPVDCVLDNDCAEGQYCVATRCADPVPLPDSREAYVTQVAPVIETGCNCHGPGSGRPYSYTHAFADPAAFDADLAVLRQWLYDPMQRLGTGADDGRPTGLLYGLAGCGFNHPGIYQGPDQPHFALLKAWADQAWVELPVLTPADVEPPPEDPPADGPLPELEAAALANILASSYRDGMVDEILPRLQGQCGCCHAGDGARSWKLLGAWPALDGDGNAIDPRRMERVTPAQVIDYDIRAIESLVDRTTPDRAPLLRYGLGANGRGEAHPIIYASADDPRYRLLRAWLVEGPPPPAN